MDHTKHKCQYRFPVSFFLTSSVRVRKIAGFRKFTIFSIKWSQCFLQISKKLSDCKTLFYVKKCYSCSTLSPSGAAAGLMVALILKLTFNLPQSSENQSCKRCLTIFKNEESIHGKGTFSLKKVCTDLKNLLWNFALWCLLSLKSQCLSIVWKDPYGTGH